MQTEIQQRREREAEFRRNIKNLEEMKQLLEEENAVLQIYNNQFGNENEQLIAENSRLKAEMAHSRQIQIPRNNS